jgi:2-aminoadipate transaminase
MRPSAIREILKVTMQPDVISFAGGLPAPELFPIEDFERACHDALSHDGRSALQYSLTEGHPPLREWVCQHLAEVGIHCKADQMMIVTGSQQGLDLMAKVLVDPGDEIVLEAPTYLGALQAFDAYQPVYATVQTDEHGIIPDALEKVLSHAKRAKLLYLTPTFQNPTGKTIPLERRKEVVRIAAKFGVPILEDDPYGRLRFSGENVPAIMGMTEGSGCAYLGTTSKIMAPGMRVAWLVVQDRELLEKLTPLKQATDLHTSTFMQRVVCAYASRPGVVNEHIEKIIGVYRHRRDLMLKTLEANMPEGVSWTRPEGGLFLWLTLPETVDANDVFERAAKEKVAFVPGKPFWAGKDVRNTLRLNFSNTTDEKIRVGIQRLGDAIREC